MSEFYAKHEPKHFTFDANYGKYEITQFSPVVTNGRKFHKFMAIVNFCCLSTKLQNKLFLTQKNNNIY